MLVPNRHSEDNYRYGFQGQEKDDEIKGEGNSLNYTFRMHDPRVGRFFAVDPLAPKYPFYSPYQFSGNRVIDMVELEGLEPAKAGTVEGQQEEAFDQSLINDNPVDAVKFLFSNQTWTWHTGTKTTVAGWNSNDSYNQIVMPIAINYAQSEGWSFGTSWQSAKDLICNPGQPSDVISQETADFLSSRNTAGNYRELLTQIGAHEINAANKARYSSATGAIATMDFDSPFFGLTFGLKRFAKGTNTNYYRAFSADELLDVANNGFRGAPGGGGYNQSKLFASSAQDASNYGRLFYQSDKKPYFILKTSVNNKYEVFFKTQMDMMEGTDIPLKFLKANKTSVIDEIPIPDHPWIKK